MSETHEHQHARPAGEGAPSDEEMRRAYEEELARVSVAEIVVQTAVSLVNLAGIRLGLAGAPGGDGGAARDLDQARDAIDAVRGLMPVVERHVGPNARSLRDALSQLQIAYAREAGAAPPGAGEMPGSAAGDAGASGAPGAPATEPPSPGAGKGPGRQGGEPGTGDPHGPGPAQSSGRLWVPGQR